MGKIIKPYEVITQLGQGGMGVVYKARSLTLKNKVVAIKQLWPQFSNNPVFVKLFLDEGEKLFNLDHRNIVKVTDILEEGGEFFIVMEYVEGRTLNEIIKREVGPIERKRAINLFRQILEGVAYIHSQPKPVIHRDLKPLNVLVTNDDTVKITDFGIAKELEEGEGSSTTMKGTPTYMSPEQIMDPKTVDIRTDIYSLGMTFYEMLCGKSPFSGNHSTTPTAVYTHIINDKVPPPTHFYPGISDALVNFVMKSIHKDREQRFPNAIEMLKELDRMDSGGQTTVQGEGGVASIYIPKPKSEVTTMPSPLVTHKSEIEHLTGNEMVLVEGGSFMMGDTDGGCDEKPIHKVTLNDFYIGQTPVTQLLWYLIMGSSKSIFSGDYLPVENISFNDAILFCNKLSEHQGLKKVYFENKSGIVCDFSSNGYRLPTEAEWEFASMGGKRNKGFKYSGGNDLNELAWYAGNSGEGTTKVRTKKPNDLDIYDMSGNVWEWCWDWYGDYRPGSENNPTGPAMGKFRVIRGGAWNSNEVLCRCTSRGYRSHSNKSSSLGLRLARTL